LFLAFLDVSLHGEFKNKNTETYFSRNTAYCLKLYLDTSREFNSKKDYIYEPGHEERQGSQAVPYVCSYLLLGSL
jgi:hypothetical protein